MQSCFTHEPVRWWNQEHAFTFPRNHPERFLFGKQESGWMAPPICTATITKYYYFMIILKQNFLNDLFVVLDMIWCKVIKKMVTLEEKTISWRWVEMGESGSMGSKMGSVTCAMCWLFWTNHNEGNLILVLMSRWLMTHGSSPYWDSWRVTSPWLLVYGLYFNWSSLLIMKVTNQKHFQDEC